MRISTTLEIHSPGESELEIKTEGIQDLIRENDHDSRTGDRENNSHLEHDTNIMLENECNRRRSACHDKQQNGFPVQVSFNVNTSSRHNQDKTRTHAVTTIITC